MVDSRVAVIILVVLAAAAACKGTPASGAPTGTVDSVDLVAAGAVSSERTLMGTRFAISVWTADREGAMAGIEAAFAEVARVEALISEWRPTSEISAVNRAAGGEPVLVGPELLEVVEAASAIARQSGGAFDITFASCGHLWSTSKRLRPTPAQLAECLPKIDHRGVEVDRGASTIRLSREGMKIGLGGIGKGFGVDRAAAVLVERGFEDFVVDGGGDVRLRGTRGGEVWKVGIQHPRRADAVLGVVSTTDGAVVSSGDYERYYEEDGVRYHHIIDPQTGEPARKSVHVTVIAADAMRADGLATALFVLGPQAGLSLVEEMEGVEALIVDASHREHTSAGFHYLESEAGAK